MALVCDPQLLLRADKVMRLRAIETRMLLKPYDWGVIDWPIENRRCPAVIVDRPAGGRVIPSLDTRTRPMHEDAVSRMLISSGGRIVGTTG